MEKKCKNCRWWREKSWVDEEGSGICENPNTMQQVTTMSEEMVSKFVIDKSEARMISQSLRFSSEFSCINWTEI